VRRRSTSSQRIAEHCAEAARLLVAEQLFPDPKQALSAALSSVEDVA
jgi:hypothetical protein